MDVSRTTMYALSADDQPLVIPHKNGTVSLHYQAWSEMPFGFTLQFGPSHVALLEALCAALKQAPSPEEEPGL